MVLTAKSAPIELRPGYVVPVLGPLTSPEVVMCRVARAAGKASKSSRKCGALGRHDDPVAVWREVNRVFHPDLGVN